MELDGDVCQAKVPRDGFGAMSSGKQVHALAFAFRQPHRHRRAQTTYAFHTPAGFVETYAWDRTRPIAIADEPAPCPDGRGGCRVRHADMGGEPVQMVYDRARRLIELVMGGQGFSFEYGDFGAMSPPAQFTVVDLGGGFR